MDTAQRILSLLHRVDPDGKRVYTDAEIAEFAPFLLVSFAPAIDPKAVPPAARALLGTLAQKLGVDGKDPGDTAARFRAHFEDNPPTPGLIEDFLRFAREELKGKLGGDGAAEGSFLSFVGSARNKQALSTTNDGARPAGTVRASPFARAHLHAKHAKHASGALTEASSPREGAPQQQHSKTTTTTKGS